MDEEGKVCTRCGCYKLRTEYYKEKHGKLGLRSRCIECMRKLDTQYKEGNLDHVRQLRRENYRDNPTIRDRQRRWESENRERIQENRRAWAEANREHLQEYRRKRYSTDPRYKEKARRDRDKRRARLKNCDYEHIDRFEVFDQDDWVCQLCSGGVPIVVLWPHPESASVDHVVPLSAPDSPGHVWSNVQTTHLRCNLKKSNKMPTKG